MKSAASTTTNSEHWKSYKTNHQLSVYHYSKRDEIAHSPSVFFSLEEAVEHTKTFSTDYKFTITIFPGCHEIKKTMVIDREVTFKSHSEVSPKKEQLKETVIFSKNKIIIDAIGNSTLIHIHGLTVKMFADPYTTDNGPWKPAIRFWAEKLNVSDCRFEMDKNEKIIGISIEKGATTLTNVSMIGGGTAVFLNENTNTSFLNCCNIEDCSSTAIVLQKMSDLIAKDCSIAGEEYGLSATGCKVLAVDCDFRGRKTGLFMIDGANATVESCSVIGGVAAVYCKDSGGCLMRSEFYAGSQCTIWVKGPVANPVFSRCIIYVDHAKSVNCVNSPKFDLESYQNCLRTSPMQIKKEKNEFGRIKESS